MSPQDFSPIVTLTNLEVEGEDFRLASEPYGPEDFDAPESLNAPDPREDRGEPSALALSTSLEPSVNSPLDWSDRVDVYADRLMDEIFTPVEHTLDSGAAPLEFEETEVLRIRSLEMPTLALPAALVPRMDAYSPQEGSALAVLQAEETAGPSPLVDRLLLGSVLVSCAITLGWWALDRDRYEVLLSSSSGTEALSTPQTAPALSPNAQFAAYLQESLKTLDSQAQGKPQTPSNGQAAPNGQTAGTTLPSVPATLPNVSSTATLPTITVPGTPSLGDLSPLPATAQVPSTVLDRVYIPVYPNTPGLAAPPSAVASSLPGVLNPAPPLMAAGNVPPAPVAAPAPLAAAPVAAPSQNTPTAQKPAVAPVPQPSTVTHSLVGILELGDQSAALFQVNGVTRRVHLGEAIGSAGWMLVEVGNQEAIIRRNGEVRSIYIGQNF